MPNFDISIAFQRMLQREIASLMGGKFMQLLMNHSVELPKFACKGRRSSAITLIFIFHMNFVLDEDCSSPSTFLFAIF